MLGTLLLKKGLKLYFIKDKMSGCAIRGDNRAQYITKLGCVY